MQQVKGQVVEYIIEKHLGIIADYKLSKIWWSHKRGKGLIG